jgi:hypothetical protein
VRVLDDGEDVLLAAALRALRGDDSGPAQQAYEQDLRERALHVLPAASACRRIVYTTKVDWLLPVLGWGDAPPEDVAVLWRWAPVGKAHVAAIRALVTALDAPLVFVGDLDPLDLATFGTLARALQGVSSTVRFAGVGDRWVELCERHLAPERTLRSVCIEMSQPERAAMRQAEEMGLGWDALAGSRGMDLLDSGLKLELEGASNPRFFSPSLAGELARLILD